MVRTISKIAAAASCLLALALFTPQAKALPTDFQCGVNCGTITQIGSNYSSSAISVDALVFNLPGFDTDEQGESFNVAFNTATGKIMITDSTDDDATLVGTITSFNQTGGRLDLNVQFTTPAGFQSFGTMHLDISNGTPCVLAASTTAAVSCTNFAAFSVDIPVTTPEPGSLLLMGTGLLGLGGLVRRRWLS